MKYKAGAISMIVLSMLLIGANPGNALSHTPNQNISLHSASPKPIKGKVSVSGSFFVGEVLRLGAPKTTPKFAKFTVQWLKDGKSILGAVGKTYKLKPSDVGAQIQARVSAKAPGYKTTKLYSSARLVGSRFANDIALSWPGYPRVVSTSSINNQVSKFFGTFDQLVELVPNVYAAYDPSKQDLSFYVETASVVGDCNMKRSYFPNRAGTCWATLSAPIQVPVVEPRPVIPPVSTLPTPSQIAYWNTIINLNNSLIKLNDASLLRLKSDLSTNQYWLSVALRYGDTLRADSIRATIASLELEISTLEAENASLRAENADLTSKINGG